MFYPDDLGEDRRVGSWRIGRRVAAVHSGAPSGTHFAWGPVNSKDSKDL